MRKQLHVYIHVIKHHVLREADWTLSEEVDSGKETAMYTPK